jgi:hypothetical protein
MGSTCTIVCNSGEPQELYVDAAGRSLFLENDAKSIAWTLAHDYPGFQFEVLNDGELVESYLVGDEQWVPVGVGEYSEQRA